MGVLVTGGAGYVGSHIVDVLAEQGRSCVAMDTLEFGSRSAVHDQAPFVLGSVADADLVRSTCERYAIDAVIHCAAYKSVAHSMRDPSAYFINNVENSRRLFETLIGVGIQHVVFSSSCSVYGNPAAIPVTEDEPIRPQSPYGESKVMVERLLSWFGRCHGLRSVSLRYFNAAGAAPGGHIGEDWTVSQNLIPLVLEAVLDRRPPVVVFGGDYPTADGTAVRDYIHVTDLAEAHLRALEYLENAGSTTVVNLGTGVGSSVLEVLRVASNVAGRPVPHEIAERREGDPACVYADNRRARDLLGWQPRLDLEAMIATAYRWHLRGGLHLETALERS